jgi:hypothetical protein
MRGKWFGLLRWLGLVIIVAMPMVIAAGCGSNADKVSKNISTKCEQFNCQRRIVGVNGITDKVEFMVVGRCSIEGSTNLPGIRALEVTCKQGPHEYKKHYLSLSDNMFFVATQLKPLDVSIYHTEIILKPQNIAPDFDLQTGGG